MKENPGKKNHKQSQSGTSTFIGTLLLIAFILGFVGIILYGLNFSHTNEEAEMPEVIVKRSKQDNVGGISKKNQQDKNELTLENKGGIYSFNNPSFAYKILNKLDIFEELPKEYHEGITYNKLYLGVIRDNNYCTKVLKHFTEHSTEVFTERNIMLDHRMNTLLRGTVIPRIAKDIHPQIHPGMQPQLRNSPIYNLGLNINIFFVNTGFHFDYYLNKHYGCLNQVYNHIYGATAMNRKSNLALNYQAYSSRFPDKPQCKPNFMPGSYVLKNHTECQMFFDYLQTDEYAEEKRQMGVVFFKKIGRGAHRGEGVFLFDEKEENNMIKEFNNGLKCAELNRDLQMQKYIPNPLLLYGHKWDFRVYMLVASTNPLIVYYHDGFLKLSAHIFDRNSTDLGVHLSNTEISKNAFDQARNGGWLGMNETELRAFQTWTYDRLHKYLLEFNYTQDTNWIRNSLVPQMKSAMVQIARMSKPAYVARSQSFELFGCDFILDENLRLWFIEANTSPMMEATTPDRENILIKMLYDHFELMFGLLRSRMKRVIQFVNQLEEELSPDFNDSIDKLPNYYQLRAQFDLINSNYMEQEYEINPKNGFEKIVDENLDDIERYAGFIPLECY